MKTVISSRPNKSITRWRRRQAAGRAISTAPRSIPTDTGEGTTQSDISQQFSNTIWQDNKGLTRLSSVTQRSYSFVEGPQMLDYSYDNPAPDFEGATSRSYTRTDYSGSYLDNGKVNRDQAPQVVESYSYSEDAQDHFTKTITNQVYRLDAWAMFAKTLLDYTDSYSYSARDDSQATGTENDPNQFTNWVDGTQIATGTSIYGEQQTIPDNLIDFTLAGFATRQSDDSQSISYLHTTYENSYSFGLDSNNILRLHYDSAPTATGWSRSFDGSTYNADHPEWSVENRTGEQQTDIYQQFSDTIWAATNGLSRLQSVTQRSYSFFEDDNMGSYSYDNPATDFEGASSRSYTVTNYANSYLDTGTVNRDAPPTIDESYSYAIDAQGHATKTILNQTFLPEAWALYAKTLLAQTEAWSYSTTSESQSQSDGVHENDGGLFMSWQNRGSMDPSSTLVYGEVKTPPQRLLDFTLADFATPQADKSENISYLKTDYTQSYELLPNQIIYTNAPTAQGWSRSFDGTAFNPDNTRSGVQQADIFQQFDTSIWQATRGVARLQTVVQRGYSFVEELSKDQMAAYSYDNPAEDFEGATNRSYTVTSYSGAYLSNGKVNPNQAPQVTESYSYSKDAQGHFTTTLTQEQFVLSAWAMFAKTLVGETESWSYSTINEDDSRNANLHEQDGGDFIDWTSGSTISEPTLVYGMVHDVPPDALSFTLTSYATPQADGSENISYLNTDYSQSYNITPGHLDYVAAPVAQGWTRSSDGSALNAQTRSGVTQSDIYQKFDDEIFVNTKGLTRLADTIQRSYSFFEDDNMASYSYYNPAPDFEGATSRSYTETTYKGSYDETTGEVNRDQPPQTGISYSYTVDAQGHTTKTLTQQTFIAAAWYNFAHTLIGTSESWSFSAMNEAASNNTDARENDADDFTNWNTGAVDSSNTLIYGEDRPIPTLSDGSTDTNLFTLNNFATAQSDGSKTISYLKTDYSQSYDIESNQIEYLRAPICARMVAQLRRNHAECRLNAHRRNAVRHLSEIQRHHFREHQRTHAARGHDPTHVQFC